jgi:DNA-binding NarL/FixJ family response regulator
MQDTPRVPVTVRQGRVMVVDDHAPLRHAWRDFIDSLPGFEVVGECDYGPDALRLALSLDPDLTFLDIRRREPEGLAIVRDLVVALPATRIIVHSGLRVWDHVLDALEAGASAYLHQDDVPYCIEPALRAALAGDVFISPSVYPERRV